MGLIMLKNVATTMKVPLKIMNFLLETPPKNKSKILVLPTSTIIGKALTILRKYVISTSKIVQSLR